MSEKTSRIIKIIRIVLALTVSLFALFLVNEEHFGEIGKIWNLVMHLSAWLLLSYDVLIEIVEDTVKEKEFFTEDTLMVLASIGAFLLLLFGRNECFEAVLILAFFQVGELFEDVAKDKTFDALTSAYELRSPIAHLKKGEDYEDIDPKTIKVGDILSIRAGELLPSDGEIIEGSGLINASSLTGESTPIEANVSSKVAAGTLLEQGHIVIVSSSNYEDNTVAKILNLIKESEESKSKVTRFVDKFASIFTPIVFLISILVMVIPPLFLGIGNPEVWNNWIYHGLCVLVISCPCSIVVSIPLAYFSGMGLAGRKGILIKGAEVFDRLYDMNVVYTDKTGTLTKGSFSLLTVDARATSEEELISLAKALEKESNHPLSKTIARLEAEASPLSFTEYQEIPGKGIKAIAGESFYLAGNAVLLEEHGIKMDNLNYGGSAVFFAKNSLFLGALYFGDEIKKGAQPLVDYLHKLHKKIYMLSGDRAASVASTAKTLNLDGFEGECSIARKQSVITEAKEKSPGQIAFIGDGINDAASLASADLSIAMGGLGADISAECSDIVLMNDDPFALAEAHHISMLVRKQAIFNIALSLSVKFAIILCSILVPSFPLFVAVIADTGLLIFCVLLSISIFLRKKKAH